MGRRYIDIYTWILMMLMEMMKVMMMIKVLMIKVIMMMIDNNSYNLHVMSNIS